MAGNQYISDPRQAEFLKNYISPKSETFANALQSALKAGYSQQYAENITGQMPDWLSEALGKAYRLDKAEKVLDKTLSYETDDGKKVDTGLLRIQTDVAKFIASTIGKDRGYSSRQELTGKDGKDLPTPLLAKIDVQDNHGSKGAEETKQED